MRQAFSTLLLISLQQFTYMATHLKKDTSAKINGPIK